MNEQDQQNRQEVTVRDNPDESRFDVFVDGAIDPLGREHLRALR